MIPVCFAWGSPSVFEVNGQTIYGCQFELLPGASMLNAQCVMHGVIGVAASHDPHAAEPIYRTVPGAELMIWASAYTEPEDLVPHQQEILQSYREHMQRLGILTGG